MQSEHPNPTLMRAPLTHEIILLNKLLQAGGITLDIQNLNVSPISDGRMGSFEIVTESHNRVFGYIASECHFIDSDNVPVLVTLNLDQFGKPFEVDIWKVDFQSILKWPKESELVLGPRHIPIQAIRQ